MRATRPRLRYLEESPPRADYWDMPVAEQTEGAVTKRVPQFLDTISVERG